MKETYAVERFKVTVVNSGVVGLSGTHSPPPRFPSSPGDAHQEVASETEREGLGGLGNELTRAGDFDACNRLFGDPFASGSKSGYQPGVLVYAPHEGPTI